MKQTLHTIIALALMVFVGSTNDAAAKDLRGTTNWSVSRVASPQAGDPYCTLARGYTDGIVLTFAINARDESSLAFDFQTKSFDMGRSYNISLAAGLDLKRDFETAPLTESAVVLKLGRDKAFFEALERAKFLGFNLAQRQFNFDFSDFSEGMVQIKACLDTFGSDTNTLALNQQLNRNELKLESMTRQIQTLEQENNALKSSLRVAQAKAEAQTLNQATPEVRTVVKEVEVIKEVPVGNDGLVQQLQSTLRSMMKQVSQLRQENAQLQDEVVKLASVPQEKITQSQEVSSGPQISQAEFDRVKRQLTDKSAALEIAEQRIENLLRSKNALEQKIQNLNQRVSVQEKTVAQNIQQSQERIVEARSRRVSTAPVPEIEAAEAQPVTPVRQESFADLIQPPAFEPDVEEYRDSGLITGVEDDGYNDIVNNPVPIKNLDAEQIPQDELRATRRDLARSRYTTARQKRIELAAQQKLEDAKRAEQRAKELKERNRFGGQNVYELAAKSNAQQSNPIFDGPGEAETTQANITTSFDAGEIRSGRLLNSELTPIASKPQAIPQTAVLEQPVTLSESKSGEVEELLARANIPVTAALSKLENISNSNFNAYQWDSGDTFGSAEVTKITSKDAFDVLSQAYLERTKRRCNGEFASIPTTGFGDNDSNLAGYDVACVSGSNQGAVAALLFTVQDSKFITIAFEATATNIEKAMRVRDQLAQSIATN